MDIKQSFQIIEQALNVATQKGSFNLAEVHQVLIALEVIKKTTEDKK